MRYTVKGIMALALVIAGGCGDGKDHAMTYSYSTATDPSTGWEIVELRADNTDGLGHDLSVRIVPRGGCNMISFVRDGIELIDSPADLHDLFKRRTGTPILYPNPNRMRNGTFTFDGETHVMKVPGENQPRTIHGLVWDDTAWEHDTPVAGESSASLTARYVFDGSNPRFAAFPYESTLTVTFTLMRDRVRIAYEVENMDDRPLGYGFGLHPFWKTIGDRDSTFIQSDVPMLMESVEMFPTGDLTPVAETDYDLSEPAPVSTLSLDDVFFGAKPSSTVRILWPVAGMQLRQVATADFTHLVIYTPNRDFFCVENQTCSTDVFNLAAAGYEEEAHLLIVRPGNTMGGHVDFIVGDIER